MADRADNDMIRKALAAPVATCVDVHMSDGTLCHMTLGALFTYCREKGLLR